MPHSETDSVTVCSADWASDADGIAQVRRRVFIEEQGVPEAMEWEALDPQCAWFTARTADGAIVGVARLTPDGRIGRMAVLPAWRRNGTGSALLAAALAEARRQGRRRVSLHAQTYVLVFYAGFGFRAEGPVFMEAGIPHQKMILELTEQ